MRHDVDMTMDWVRLGAAVKASRKAMRITQPQLGAAVGVGRATVQNIESGQEYARVTPTLRAIERALDWQEGSIELVLAGGDPVALGAPPLPEPVPEPVRRGGGSVPGRLPLKIVQELEEGGPVLDARVLDLAPGGGNGKMIVVVTGEVDATPDQIRAALLAWERAELRLQADDDGDTPPSAEQA
jgi:transcriptional regulator with XRE-family HTH domain